VFDCTGVRNRALLALLYRGGLRLGEALKLRPKDLDLEHGAVRVLHAKGGRSRTAGIDPGAAAEVARWLALRGTWSLPPLAPVFCTASGRGVTQAYVRRLLPVLGARAGIEKRVHAHGLRHTHAAQLRQEGLDIGIISKQLGHRSIATTARYLDHICPLAVVEAMRGRSW
jgi:site-specific recombinase XerD